MGLVLRPPRHFVKEVHKFDIMRTRGPFGQYIVSSGSFLWVIYPCLVKKNLKNRTKFDFKQYLNNIVSKFLVRNAY